MKATLRGTRAAPTLVAVVGHLERAARSALPPRDEAVCVDLGAAGTAQFERVEVLFVWDFRWRGLEALLPRMASLRWIHAASAGVDHLLIPAVRDRRIAITNSAGVFERPIAEYVLALVLARAKGLHETILAQRERRWAYRRTDEIRGKTMLVVGLGRIGTAVASLAQAAGMDVIGVRRTTGNGPVRTLPPHRLHDALALADYVVLAAALTPETRHMIGRAALSAMKSTAYLINVARGALVDGDALVDALARGTIAGAALDVFDDEPLPEESPLWTAPGLLVSPHMSGDAEDWDSRVVELFAQNLRRYRAGEELTNVLDVSRGY